MAFHNVIAVYVFLGDHYAMVDFVRYLYIMNISKSGEYVVIAVQLTPYNKHKNYFEKGTVKHVSLHGPIESSYLAVCVQFTI